MTSPRKILKPRTTFALSLGVVTIASLICRIGYVAWQSAHDPGFARPGLDGGYYVAWARGLGGGAGEPQGVFYLAPLYPHLLAAFFGEFGERFGLLYALQQTMIVGAASLLALGAERAIGATAAVAAATVVLLYHPTVFFASRPIGEPVALLLAAAAVYLCRRTSLASATGAGVAIGLATLARANLLVVAVGLAALEGARGQWTRALVLGAAATVTLAPVALRNYVAGGHAVLVSSNAGLTLYHGNGPGAVGVFTPAAGFSGSLERQRDEATLLARARTGRALDAVDADRWWGREALHARLDDPLGTIRLLSRRAALLFDNYEHGLDDAPRLDENPWRRTFPLPLAVLLALATVGAVTGFAASGGLAVWVPIAATAATPLVFYVSSRYRLPMAFFLGVPAGVGAAAIFGVRRPGPWRGRLALALAAGVVVGVGSLLVPSTALARTEEAAAHANRAAVFAEVHDLDGAQAEAGRALALDPSNILARYNLAVALGKADRKPEAEALYRDVLARDPTHAESAGNLAKLLVERGAATEAIPILERALAGRPADATCWTNLIVASISTGDWERARRAVSDAKRIGVVLAPELVAAAGAGGDTMRRSGERGR